MIKQVTIINVVVVCTVLFPNLIILSLLFLTTEKGNIGVSSPKIVLASSAVAGTAVFIGVVFVAIICLRRRRRNGKRFLQTIM